MQHPIGKPRGPGRPGARGCLDRWSGTLPLDRDASGTLPCQPPATSAGAETSRGALLAYPARAGRAPVRGRVRGSREVPVHSRLGPGARAPWPATRLPAWISARGAEGEGFEPSIRLTTDNGFRDRRIRPLCHPSAGGRRTAAGAALSGEGGIRTLDGAIQPHNALAGRRLQPLGHFSEVRTEYRSASRRNSPRRPSARTSRPTRWRTR
jgi:hypothetical protein